MAKTTQYSAVHLIPEANVDPGLWNTFPDPAAINRTVKEIEKRGITVVRARDGSYALESLKKIIPTDAEVMSGSSTTLIEIGFEEFISGRDCTWKNIHTRIFAENDEVKRAELRRKSVTSDYYVSGVNAIAQTGEMVGCDASGSRVGAWAFAAGHLVLVAGVNKIVPTLSDALDRVRNYVYPLENVRALKVYGVPSAIAKIVILEQERTPGRITLVMIDETLGY
jgi:hypothetical protein